MTQRSAQNDKKNSAAFSFNAPKIIAACKRNAAVRNIAFGSDDLAIYRAPPSLDVD